MEMPQIQALHDEFEDKSLRKYFAQGKNTFRNLLDPDKDVLGLHGPAGLIARVVLIGKDDIVRYYQQGYSNRPDLHSEVMKLGLK